MARSIDDQLAELRARGIDVSRPHQIEASFCLNGSKAEARAQLEAKGFHHVSFQASNGWNNIPADWAVLAKRVSPATERDLLELINQLQTDLEARFVEVEVLGLPDSAPYYVLWNACLE